ncbi:MAG: outer membrane protein assembly factor BamB [Ideonella sp.]
MTLINNLGKARLFAPAALLVGAMLAGCASGPDKPKPGPLEPIIKPIAAPTAWQQKIGDIQFPMAVAVNAGTFTVASTDGTVLALQSETGRELWRASVGARLSAGVGSDGRYAAVVTRANEVVVLEAGRTVWRKKLGVRVNTEPLVAGERVFVLGSDRSVQAFDAVDGRVLWEVKRSGDPLTLAQRGVIAAYKDTLLVGQGARLAGLNPQDGSVRWEVAVATPRGTNEIERLADLVGPAVRIGDVVCARSFQAAVSCINAERGSLAWSKNLGGTDGVAAEGQLVAAADASDRISAWKAASGEVAWTSEKLLYRQLGTPAMTADSVIFGDVEGTLHFLSRTDGATQLRLSTDGSGIVGVPAVLGKTVLVVTRSGGLFAFRTE